MSSKDLLDKSIEVGNKSIDHNSYHHPNETSLSSKPKWIDWSSIGHDRNGDSNISNQPGHNKMSYHRRERIGPQDLLYPQRSVQEDQKRIFEVCRDGKEHVNSHIEKVMFSGHKEMTYHRRESLSPRERIDLRRNAKHGQERDYEPSEFNEQLNSKSTKPMVQGDGSIPKNPKINSHGMGSINQ